MPDSREAGLLRDYIASYLNSDPRRANALSARFLQTLRGKPQASEGALAAAWRARAEAWLYAGEYKAARSAYEKACSFAASAGERGLLGCILVGRIGTLLVMGEFASIPPLRRRAEVLLQESGNEDYLRRLHINLGSGHYHRERYAEARASFARALRLMENTGQRDDLWASVTLNFGIACTQLGRVNEARRAFARTEEYGRAHGRQRLFAQAMFNRGSLEAFRGGYRSALGLLAEAEEIFARQEVRELLAATRLEMAQIHLDLSMPLEGRGLARLAAEEFLAEEMLLDAQLARLAEARSLFLLQSPGEAIGILESADAFYLARRIPARRAQVLLDLARALAAQGTQSAARTAVEKALRLTRRLGLESLDCACRCVRADLFLRQGNPGRAERALAGVIPSLPRLPVRERLEYWTTAARTARSGGRTALAGSRYRTAARYLEAERALIPGLELRASSFERSVGVYHEQISLLISRPRPSVDRVLRLMERASGRTFREMATAPGVARDGEVAELREVLGSTMRRLDGILMWDSSSDREESERLRRKVLHLEREITRRVRRIEVSQESVRGLSSLRGAAEVARLLAPGEAVLRYFVAEDRILAVVISEGRRSLHLLDATPAAVASRLERLWMQLDTLAVTAGRPLGDAAFLRRSAEIRLRELFDMILRPVLADLPQTGRLIVIPHALLHHLPFECLHDGGGYIDQRWEIQRCPTGDFFVERRSRTTSTGQDGVLVVAGTRPGSSFIEEEARVVSRCWPEATTRLLFDPRPEEALQAMREARIIHVSAHGSFRDDNPLFSVLHLGSRALFLTEVLETPLTAEIAVLSACNSGQATSGRGDALVGVAHAFLAAGADRLVASLWRVHDEATAGWMGAFHRILRETGDPVNARCAASKALREEWPHPFYWGGFYLLGA